MMIQRLGEIDRDTAKRLAELCTELGYPTSAGQLEMRIRPILRDSKHACFIAVSQTGVILGWVHVFSRPLLVQDTAAEIGGLIVDEAYRGEHIGETLMRKAEDWAFGQGLKAVFVRSNIQRLGAHDFYPAIGYEYMKTSKTYMKSSSSKLS